MPNYTWHRDIRANTCTQIECDTFGSANAMQNHLNAQGIKCWVQGVTVQFESAPSFMDVIRASESFLGTRLINENE